MRVPYNMLARRVVNHSHPEDSAADIMDHAYEIVSEWRDNHSAAMEAYSLDDEFNIAEQVAYRALTSMEG